MGWLERINPQVHHVWSGTWARRFVEPLRTLYDHELVVFVSGACEVRIDDEVFPCPAPSYIVIPPGRLHLSLGGEGRPLRHCVHFDWTHSAGVVGQDLWVFWPEKPVRTRVRTAPRFVPGRVLHGPIADPALVMPLAQSLVQRWKSPREGDRATVRALFLELVVRLLSPRATGEARQGRPAELAIAVRDALDRVDLATTSIRDALRALGHSYEHLMREFKKAFGITPLRYVNSSRMERAKLLLRGPDVKVSDVARGLGFEDAGYFTRAFRKYTGVTPGAYAGRG